MKDKFSKNFITIVSYTILVICMFSSLRVLAQKEEKLSHYHLQVLKNADEYFNAADYYNALTNYEKILKKSVNDTSIILKVAECYKMLNSFVESETWYRTVLDSTTDDSAEAKYKLDYAQVLTINGKYKEALYWYRKYFLSNSIDTRGIAGIRTIESLNKLYNDTMFYVVYPTEINTVYSEFSPVFYNNGIVFVSDRPDAKVSEDDDGSKTAYTNWYFGDTKDTINSGDCFQFGRNQNINLNYNAGPLVFYDNYQKMIFTQNTQNKIDSKEKVIVYPIQLFSASRSKENSWDEIKTLDFCDKNYSYGQPAITRDGKTLIFSSNLPGGYGGSDLYSSKSENDIWQEPVNMGEKINSRGNEMFPYILNDSVLYFSSDGHGGLGGLDICYVSLNKSSDPIKIGLPVNSSGDDFGIVFDEDGMSGYLASNRAGSKGSDDIYAFKIIRITLFLKIVDQTSSIPVSDAEVYSIIGLDETPIGTTDKDGYCKVVIPVSKEIVIKVRKENFESQVFSVEPMKYKTETSVLLSYENKLLKMEELPKSDNGSKIYKVQIMASREPSTKRQLNRKYKGDMVISMNFEDNWYKYTIGEFNTYREACICLDSCKVYDAFVPVYKNNIRAKILFPRPINKPVR